MALQGARGSPPFHLLGIPRTAHPRGAIRHSPVPPTDPFAPLACSCQLDPPAPDSNTAPRGLRSARTRAAPLRHPTPTDHQSRYSLTRVYRGSPGYVFLYSLRFFRVCQGPELHLQSNSLAVCSRDTPSPRRCVAPTLSLGLAPSPILIPFRRATPVSKNSTTERVYSWAIGPQPATPPQRGDSSGVPRCPRADRPRAASVRSPARGHNLDRGPAPVFSWGRPPPGALPRRTPTGRNHSRALGPLPALPQPGGTRPGSPATPLRLPSRRVGSRPTRGHGFGRVLRPPAPELANGPISHPGTLRGRRVGPHSLGHFLQLSPSARTSTGPEKVRFRMFSRRPLRSEKFRHAPSPGPWPRPPHWPVKVTKGNALPDPQWSERRWPVGVI
ncbi:hypothetical protein NDU88_010310 [Pleurodeles waltl]|uniref:Basic proline-rich protein-like n=1 Tax=Pleurodeles waltl TaxID=8319 RepID=A0AAV7S0A9_PLEWA|nr:hypothetical protein NDU88_010310 [Pleurodeles waltl]